jgi:hypothetical protein
MPVVPFSKQEPEQTNEPGDKHLLMAAAMIRELGLQEPRPQAEPKATAKSLKRIEGAFEKEQVRSDTDPTHSEDVAREPQEQGVGGFKESDLDKNEREMKQKPIETPFKERFADEKQFAREIAKNSGLLTQVEKRVGMKLRLESAAESRK